MLPPGGSPRAGRSPPSREFIATGSSVTAGAQAMHEHRQRLDRHRIEARAPGRHRAVACIGNRLDEVFKVRRRKAASHPLGWPSPSQHCPCRRRRGTTAQLSAKIFLPAATSTPGFRLKLAQRAHVAGDLLDLLRLQDAVVAEGGHRAGAGVLVVVGADAVGDRRLDVVERAAPQPVFIGQVAVALRALAARAVAGRAIFGERRLAVSQRQAQQLLVGDDLRPRSPCPGPLPFARAAPGSP